MSARWVAGSVRARAMAHGRLTVDIPRVATRTTLAEALAEIAPTSYAHRLGDDDDLSSAQHQVADSVLWDLRVLAGWLPRDATGVVRILAGWFEIANVDERLRQFAGANAGPEFVLGSLATPFARLAATRSPAEIRSALAASAWGDPGSDAERDIGLGMRLSWADRVCAGVPFASAWARGATAIVVLRERLVAGLDLPSGAHAAARRLLGEPALRAGTLDEFREALDRDAQWAVPDSSDRSALAGVEIAWWRRVRADAARLLAQSGAGPAPVVGAVAALAVDAWRIRAALEQAARGGLAVGEIDALA